LVIAAGVALCVILAAIAWVSLAHGRELVPGQYAQVPEAIQQWYKSVRSPNGVPCCDIADGHKTEYRVEADGIYWVPIEGNWLPVPRESVVYTAGNPEDSAVVWYIKQGGAGDSWHIRCFVPNGGV
jgi:hypothetical protein